MASHIICRKPSRSLARLNSLVEYAERKEEGLEDDLEGYQPIESLLGFPGNPIPEEYAQGRGSAFGGPNHWEDQPGGSSPKRTHGMADPHASPGHAGKAHPKFHAPTPPAPVRRNRGTFMQQMQRFRALQAKAAQWQQQMAMHTEVELQQGWNEPPPEHPVTKWYKSSHSTPGPNFGLQILSASPKFATGTPFNSNAPAGPHNLPPLPSQLNPFSVSMDPGSPRSPADSSAQPHAYPNIGPSHLSQFHASTHHSQIAYPSVPTAMHSWGYAPTSTSHPSAVGAGVHPTQAGIAAHHHTAAGHMGGHHTQAGTALAHHHTAAGSIQNGGPAAGVLSGGPHGEQLSSSHTEGAAAHAHPHQGQLSASHAAGAETHPQALFNDATHPHNHAHPTALQPPQDNSRLLQHLYQPRVAHTPQDSTRTHTTHPRATLPTPPGTSLLPPNTDHTGAHPPPLFKSQQHPTAPHTFARPHRKNRWGYKFTPITPKNLIPTARSSPNPLEAVKGITGKERVSWDPQVRPTSPPTTANQLQQQLHPPPNQLQQHPYHYAQHLQQKIREMYGDGVQLPAYTASRASIPLLPTSRQQQQQLQCSVVPEGDEEWADSEGEEVLADGSVRQRRRRGQQQSFVLLGEMPQKLMQQAQATDQPAPTGITTQTQHNSAQRRKEEKLARQAAKLQETHQHKLEREVRIEQKRQARLTNAYGAAAMPRDYFSMQAIKPVMFEGPFSEPLDAKGVEAMRMWQMYCAQMQQQGHVPEHHAMHSSQEMSAFKDKHSQQQLHKDGAQGHGVVEDGHQADAGLTDAKPGSTATDQETGSDAAAEKAALVTVPTIVIDHSGSTAAGSPGSSPPKSPTSPKTAAEVAAQAAVVKAAAEAAMTAAFRGADEAAPAAMESTQKAAEDAAAVTASEAEEEESAALESSSPPDTPAATKPSHPHASIQSPQYDSQLSINDDQELQPWPGSPSTLSPEHTHNAQAQRSSQHTYASRTQLSSQHAHAAQTQPEGIAGASSSLPATSHERPHISFATYPRAQPRVQTQYTVTKPAQDWDKLISDQKPASLPPWMRRLVSRTMAAGLTAYSWGSSRPVSHSDASSSTRSHVLDNDIVSAMRVSRPPTVSVGQAEPREHAPGMRNEQSLGGTGWAEQAFGPMLHPGGEAVDSGSRGATAEDKEAGTGWAGSERDAGSPLTLSLRARLSQQVGGTSPPQSPMGELSRVSKDLRKSTDKPSQPSRIPVSSSWEKRRGPPTTELEARGRANHTSQGVICQEGASGVSYLPRRHQIGTTNSSPMPPQALQSLWAADATEYITLHGTVRNMTPIG